VAVVVEVFIHLAQVEVFPVVAEVDHIQLHMEVMELKTLAVVVVVMAQMQVEWVEMVAQE
jgi:hypothetical protein